MYRIGYFSGNTEIQKCRKLESQLITGGEDIELKEYDYPVNKEDSNEVAMTALKTMGCDVFCLDLTLVDKGLMDDFVIAALSERNTKFNILLYNKDPAISNPHIQLSDNACVGVSDIRSKMLAQALFSDWNIKIINKEEININQLLSELDGIIIENEHNSINDEEIMQYAHFQFHPKEFIPRAAQNVSAYLIRREDKELRKILAGIHISDVSQATNIERTIEADLINRGWNGISVYCIVDHNAHYHIYVSGVEPVNNAFKRTRYSSSTSENVVKNVFDLLTKID